MINLPNYIGLEIEFESTQCNRVYYNENYFKLVRDASVETKIKSIKDIPIIKSAINIDVNKTVLGGEIVLRYPITLDTLSSDDFQYNLSKTLNSLHGEYNSYRSSIHVHIDIKSFDPGIYTFRNIARLMNRYESLIYRLSCMRNEHRGSFNNFNYYRPYTNKGVACYKVYDSNENDSYYYGQLFNLSRLIKSKTLKEFFSLYGDSSRNMEWKYHPVRYHGINLFSYLRHGTIEYRTMNFTSSFIDIMSMVLFFYYLTSIMLSFEYKDIQKLGVNPVNSVFYPNHADNYILLDLILSVIPDKYAIYKKNIIELFDKGTYPKLKDLYYKSHMVTKSDRILFMDFPYDKPDKIEYYDIIEPTFIDIHNVII